MHPEVEELKPKLKEILYDCAVEIRATKAALYLWDANSTRFELVSEYGFRATARQNADQKDPIVDRCGRGRNPFFINGLATEPRFSELLYEASTDRLLAAPIYMRGQLVGFIDMRDKAGKQPFEQPDIAKAQRIADRIGALFVNTNVFGLRFITLSEADESGGVGAASRAAATEARAAVATAPPPAQPAAAPPPPPAAPREATISAQAPIALPQVQPRQQQSPPPPAAAPAPRAERPPQHGAGPARAEREPQHLPPVTTLIVEARKAAARIGSGAPAEVLTESELALVRESMKSILLIPGVLAASFSAFEQMGGVQEFAANGPLAPDAVSLLQSRLTSWLAKRGETASPLRPNVQPPSNPTALPVTAVQLQKVFTAPVTVAAMGGLYLTVAFEDAPDRTAHELLATGLNQLQSSIDNSLARTTLLVTRQRIAEKLVEPDLSRYPELRRHTDLVVARVDQFARALGLLPRDAEIVHLVAMVHDCGMRLLDYDNLYLKRDLTSEELAILRDHVFVGAAIVEPLLGAEVAAAVLAHHERVDGRGYPNELRGEAIPYASRLLQVCDAYVAITDTHTYQPVEPPEDALQAIERGAGSQFDAELAKRFVAMMRAAQS